MILTVNTGSVSESGGTFMITPTLSGTSKNFLPYQTQVNVITNGFAMSGVDYTLSSDIITFATGATTGNVIMVTVTNNT